MGIPQLLQHLEKLVKPKTKSYPTTSSSGSSTADDAPFKPAAVIDGSAVAHFIFNRYLKTLDKDERIPEVLGFDYGAYQRTMIRWLERLEAGFRITHIFVDGHLPAYKSSTRLSRVQTTVNHLSRLRNLSPSLIDLHKVPNWSPTPPFLIAAFSAAIAGHERYGNLIRTVPGEADAFCAAAAIAEDGFSVVFTGDSDLVVYPCAETTRVAILNDVVFEASGVKVVLWNPFQIEKKLGGEGRVLELAWCLLNDTLRVAKALASGKGDGLAGVKVGKEFREQYTLPKLELVGDRDPPGVVLDSRAAEVIYASPRYRRLCHPPVEDKEGEVEVYLPVLIEDVAKSSAWNIGRGTRRVAYKMLFGNEETVVEVHRKGAGVNRSYIKLNSEEEDTQLIRDDLEELPESVNELLISVIMEIVEDYLEKGMPLSDIDILALLAAITKSSSDTTCVIPTVSASLWTWPRAQLLAQLTAGIWSLYLLQTVISLPGIGSTVDLDVVAMERLTSFPDLLDTLDASRFISVYALSPGKTSNSKNAKKRARKRAKTEAGQDTSSGTMIGILRKIFAEDERTGVEKVVDLVEKLRRNREMEEDQEDEDEGIDTYMGMTVG